MAAFKDEKRTAARKAIAARGKIILTNGFKFDIKVRNLTTKGAQLDAGRFLILPDRFDVEIMSPCETKIKKCSTVRRWQHQNKIGVEFLSSEVLRIG